MTKILNVGYYEGGAVLKKNKENVNQLRWNSK